MSLSRAYMAAAVIVVPIGPEVGPEFVGRDRDHGLQDGPERSRFPLREPDRDPAA